MTNNKTKENLLHQKELHVFHYKQLTYDFV